MKTTHTIYRLFFLLALTLMVSCEKDEDETLRLSRMFRPAEIATLNGQTQAAIGWRTSLFTLPGEVDYVVEISRDSAGFSTIDFTTTTRETEIIVTDQQVPFIRQELFARVKAIGNDRTADSNWEASAAFMITGEQLFLPFVSSNISDKSIILQWQPGSDFTRIILTPSGGTPIEVTLTTDESTAGSKQIDNLTASKSYTAELFKGSLSKGTVTFTTKPAITGTVVHLETSTDPNILSTTLSAPALVSGSIILLKRGFTYTMPTYSFSKSVTIMSAYELGVAAPAKINNNSFNIVAGSTIDSIIFRDVFIYTPDMNTTKYAFNINTACTVKKLVFDNCRVENVRSMARGQASGGGAKINNLIINNCVVDSVRDFGVIAQNNTSVFANVLMQNSTFYKAQRIIVSSSTVATTSVTVRNCTFHDMPTGGADKTPATNNYFIDYGTSAAVAPSITIQNCIFGKTRSDFTATPSTAALGLRTGGPAPTVTGCYSTNDFVIYSNPPTVPDTKFGTITYNKTSVALWQNPKGGDFHFKDLTFPAVNSAGDPRWKP